MIITIVGTDIDVTPAIRDYVEKKLEHLEKFFEKDDSGVLVTVEVGKTTNHHASGPVFKADIVLVDHGKEHVVKCVQEDLYAAIDEMKDRISEELTSSRDRDMTLARRGDRDIKNMVREPEELESAE
jgi:putative sigma-54 modulation protein